MLFWFDYGKILGLLFVCIEYFGVVWFVFIVCVVYVVVVFLL